MNSSEVKPKLIVFDLDYTLWPFWVDTHVTPPFRKSSSNKIVDAHGKTIKPYKDVPSVLEQLYKDGYQLGVASRTCEINGARQLIELFGWSKYFSYKEIYPGCKVTHFKKFQENTDLLFSDMLFFDDEHRNIVDLNKIGVTSILVENGVDFKVVKEGLQKFTEEHSSKI